MIAESVRPPCTFAGSLHGELTLSAIMLDDPVDLDPENRSRPVAPDTTEYAFAQPQCQWLDVTSHDLAHVGVRCRRSLRLAYRNCLHGLSWRAPPEPLEARGSGRHHCGLIRAHRPPDGRQMHRPQRLRRFLAGGLGLRGLLRCWYERKVR